MTQGAPRYDVPRAAPEPLDLVQQFVNSFDEEHAREWLSGPEDLRRWLRGHGLPAPRGLSDADTRRARELREALRALIAGEDGAVTRANRLAAGIQLTVRFEDSGRTVLTPDGTGLEAAFARILGIVHDAIADGTWERLKTCSQCHWAFYDESRNRSAQWCSMSICGNRRKTRAYRARHRS